MSRKERSPQGEKTHLSRVRGRGGRDRAHLGKAVLNEFDLAGAHGDLLYGLANPFHRSIRVPAAPAIEIKHLRAFRAQAVSGFADSAGERRGIAQ